MRLLLVIRAFSPQGLRPALAGVRTACGLFVLLLLLTAIPAQAGTLSVVGRDTWAKVEKEYDGDTFRTTDGEKVRLLGIDAPELAHSAERGEPLGPKSKHFLQGLIEGKLVRLKRDKEKRDRYGRQLSHVYLRDGTWVNGAMVSEGLALVYTFAPNLHFANDLLRLEKAARDQKLGIWATSRFRVLQSTSVSNNHIGQFRLVQGEVTQTDKNGYGFRLDSLNISIPRKYRAYFKKAPNIRKVQQVLVRGTIRTSNGKLFLALHSPFDLEIIKP